jgi:uncharacterized protein with PIN domain
MAIINQCMLCEATIPGGSRVCPECGNPIRLVRHDHVWAPASVGSKPPEGKSTKYICRECGRLQTMKKFKYQRHHKA